MVMANEYCIECGHISNCKSNCQRNREHRKEERKQNFSCFCDYGHIQTPMEKMVVGAICVCLIIKPSFARHFLFSCSFHFFTLFFSLFLPVSLSVLVAPVQKTGKQKSDTQTGIALRGWFSAIIIEPPVVWSLCSSYHGICQWLPQERLHATGCFPSKH